MKFVQAKHFTRGRSEKAVLVVIHTMEYPERDTAAEWCGSFFAGDTAPMASCHYAVDADSIVQCVDEKDTAWHAGPVNGFSIGIEHGGYAKQSDAEWDDVYSIDMLARSAELVADICQRHGIVPVRLTAAELAAGRRVGICGHADVTNGLQGGKGHWDPGPSFPWDEYLDMVRSRMATPAWVRVGEYLVAPEYIAPVGIGEAAALAKKAGCELPTPELVDAIWEAADLKIDPVAMVPNRGDSPGQFLDHKHHVDGQIAGRKYRLLAGTHKDVVQYKGKIGLYGWHHADGDIIQPFYAGHSSAWKDYSQGLRLVRRVGPDYSSVSGYQARLLELGFSLGPVDGKRGPKTIAAVKAFQAARGLVPDGIVGPKTMAALVAG